MGYKEKFLEIIRSQVGVCEPSGDDKYLAAYNKLTGAKLSMQDSWCAAFVTWCARQANIPTTVIPNFASCGVCISWAKSKKLWHAGTSYTPVAGDLIFFDWSINGKRDGVQDHVGVVTGVEKGYVRTIEGNTRGGKAVDGVREKMYPLNSADIFGYMAVKWPTEKKTATNKVATIKDVQMWLNSNYNSGLVVDGIYGPKTRRALILAIQKAVNSHYSAHIDLDGIWTTLLKRTWRNVSKGAKTVFVYFIQCGLICHGYAVELDGDFGKETLAAVNAFQKANKIEVDGIVGKNTMTLLVQ